MESRAIDLGVLTQRVNWLQQRVDELEGKVEAAALGAAAPEVLDLFDARMVGGFRVDGADVEVFGGEAQIGDDDPVVVSGSTSGTYEGATGNVTVTIGADYSYVGYEYAVGTKVLSVEDFGSTKPKSTATMVKKWLYCFRFVDGKASLWRVSGALWMPAVMDAD